MSVEPGPSSYAEFYQTSAYAAFEQEYRSGGTFGLNMLEVRQDAIEMIDPAMSDVAFVSCRNAGGYGELDFGDGWKRHRMVPGVVDIQPAHQDCGFRIPALDLRVLFLPQTTLAAQLDTVGLTPSALDAVTGTFQFLPRAASLIDIAWSAAEGMGPAASLLIDGAFTALLGDMLRAAGDDRLHAPLPAIGDARLARVVDFVEAHLDKALTVGELAAVACVSVFHFARLFRDATGQTPHRYVMGRRFERAKALMLAEPALDLTSVAQATGFASQSHLTEVFHARVGVPPGAWRREMVS